MSAIINVSLRVDKLPKEKFVSEKTIIGHLWLLYKKIILFVAYGYYHIINIYKVYSLC